MPRKLLHICGPISINTYGTVIMVALLIFIWLLHKHPFKKKIFAHVDLIQVLTVGVLLGIVGGRILYLLSNLDTIESPIDLIDIWNGGFSVLGSVIVILFGLPIYLRLQHIPVIPFFDLIAIHAPLLQSISRLGCFFAGCCYGKPTELSWGVIYKKADTFAPMGEYLHPTQLYSSVLLLIIFCIMYFFAQKRLKKPGQLIALYLLLISFERFIVDFLRNDQEFFGNHLLHLLSINQWICLGIAFTASSGLWYFSSAYNKSSYQ